MSETQSIPPITSEADLDAAIKEIDGLLMLDRDETQEARLDALSDAVEAYEDEHHPMPPVSDEAMLAHLIDACETTVRHVAETTGVAEGTLLGVLAGEVVLDGPTIESLARYFNVKPSVFEDRAVAATLLGRPTEEAP